MDGKNESDKRGERSKVTSCGCAYTALANVDTLTEMSYSRFSFSLLFSLFFSFDMLLNGKEMGQ